MVLALPHFQHRSIVAAQREYLKVQGMGHDAPQPSTNTIVPPGFQGCSVVEPLSDHEICTAAMHLVSSACCISVVELLARSRRRKRVAQARQIAMYVSHVEGGLTMQVVGQHFRRDRTTVGHACRVVEDWRDDPMFDCWMNEVFSTQRLFVQVHALNRIKKDPIVLNDSSIPSERLAP